MCHILMRPAFAYLLCDNHRHACTVFTKNQLLGVDRFQEFYRRLYFCSISYCNTKYTRCDRKVMRLIFIHQIFYFFKQQCYPLQNSSLGQLHTDGDVVPTFGSSTGSIQSVWSSACPLHSWPNFFYKNFLERLRKRALRVRSNIADNWMLHHDKAPCHTALSVTEFLHSEDIPVVPQPPFTWPQPLWLFPFFLNLKKDVILGL